MLVHEACNWFPGHNNQVYNTNSFEQAIFLEFFSSYFKQESMIPNSGENENRKCFLFSYLTTIIYGSWIKMWLTEKSNIFPGPIHTREESQNNTFQTQ